MNDYILIPVSHTRLRQRNHVRMLSTLTKLSHVDDSSGKATMVNVGDKTPTRRTAIASAVVNFKNPAAFELVKRNTIKKGDVLSVSRVAGIQACKSTPHLIPLCHNIPLSHISVDFELIEENLAILIKASVETGQANTGVEVEAMVLSCEYLLRNRWQVL